MTVKMCKCEHSEVMHFFGLHRIAEECGYNGCSCENFVFKEVLNE
jgi:hypothetical protein